MSLKMEPEDDQRIKKNDPTTMVIVMVLLGIGIIIPPILLLNIPILILRSFWIHWRSSRRRDS